MAFGIGQAAYVEKRSAPREEVSYRTRARRPNGLHVPVQIVNVSASGFMARTDEDLEPGQRLYLKLPSVGAMTADVRWALGGRIGCQFETPVSMVPYLEMLAGLVQDSR